METNINNLKKYSLLIKNNSADVQKVSITDYLKSNPMQPEIEIKQTHGDKEMLTSDFCHIFLMRCLYDFSTDFMFNKFYLNGNAYHYFDSFSTNQFQTDMIDVLTDYTVTKESTIEVDVPANSQCVFSFYMDGISDKVNPMGMKPTNGIWLVLENDTIDVTIDLMDIELWENKLNSRFIKTGLLKNNSSNNLIYPNLKNPLLRMFSRSMSQLSSTINHNKKLIEPQSYISAMQFQSTVVNVPLLDDVKCGDKFEVKLLPNTKLLLSMCEYENEKGYTIDVNPNLPPILKPTL